MCAFGIRVLFMRAIGYMTSARYRVYINGSGGETTAQSLAACKPLQPVAVLIGIRPAEALTRRPPRYPMGEPGTVVDILLLTVASTEACLCATPPSRGTDTKTTTEADSPPLRTECVGTNPITLESRLLQKLGPRRQPMDYRLDLRPRLQPFHGRSSPITDMLHPPLFTQITQLCQIMNPTQIFTNGAPEYGICVVAYTRDSRGNHPGPGGKPAQYHSKTPPKGHTWFTHTTKNKVERLPSLRARATVPLSHTHAHTCMVPQRSCAVHGPARDLGCPSALRHTATAPCSVKLLQVGWLQGGQAPILQPRTSPASGSGGSQLFALGSPDVLLAPCQARAQLAGFRRVWIVRAREPAVRI